MFEASELILNADGSIYHLGIKPEHLAQTIISVGDPERVEMVASFFDSIEFQYKKREFHTTTGTYNGKRISIVSTGIGTDNIDIVFNELDALANIDFQNRSPKLVFSPLEIIRVGTSGAIQKDIPIDSFLLSETAIGFDGLLHYYQHKTSPKEEKFLSELENQLSLSPKLSKPYAVDGDEVLGTHFSKSDNILLGTTATLPGFYAPQGRMLRAVPKDKDFLTKLASFRHGETRITNLEMETAGIYGMAKLLGHRAVSLNAILANRITGEFSANPEKTVMELIETTLECLT